MDPDPLSFLFSNILAVMPAISDAVLCVFLLVLIVVNAIISGSEFAFFSINQKLIDDSQEVTATQKTTLTRLLSKPEKLLATIVISYNLLNIAIAAIAIYLLNRLPYFSGTPLQGLVPEVIIIVCIIVLFVEILPKLYASHNPLKYIGSAIPVVVLMNAVIGPLSTLLVRTTNLFNRSTIQRKHEISMDNLSKALEITSNDTIHEQEKDMLEGIIRFKDKTVDDIFISRIDMVALDSRTPFSEVIKFIVEAGFSRIPVYDENPDNIKGILYVKDLLAYLDKDDSYHWLSLIRPAYFVPRTKRIDDLLEEFRANKNHMAIVVDEYGGTSGLVTMEDILEEIVGDISDEYDEETAFYTKAADGSYIFEGKTSLDDFIKITGVAAEDFDKMSEEVDTIAGLLLELKGDFPKRKEIIVYKKYTFQAEEMNKRRIVKVRYIPPKA